MASLPVRDPVGDHLLTPQNSALVVIDYQPSQFAGVRSMDRDLLLENIVSTVKTAKAFDMPIVHSTINVATGRGQPTVYPVVDAIGGTGEESHRAGIERVVQAGAQPVTWVALAVELQRDWAREETVADVIQIVLTDRLLKA
jgi:nicotinamidase-related amidase